MQEGAFPEDLRGTEDSRSTVGPGLKADATANVSWDKCPTGLQRLGPARHQVHEIRGGRSSNGMGPLSQSQKLSSRRAGEGRAVSAKVTQ